MTVTAEHTHSWAVDRGQAGFSCVYCPANGWDWQQDEIKRLKAQIREAVTAEHTHHWQVPEPCGHAEHPGKFINDWTDKERGAFLVGQKMAQTERDRLRDEIVWMRERVERAEAAIDQTWRPEVTALGALVKETAKECGLQKTDNARLRAELQAREAVVLRMEAALKAVEWSLLIRDGRCDDAEALVYEYCPWCKVSREAGHMPTCVVGRALDAVPRRAGTEEVA